MNDYIRLAKTAVENFITDGKTIFPLPDLPKNFYNQKAGVFVSIHKGQELRGLPRSQAKLVLRGCIGTYLATKDNLAQEIVSSAIAASQDPRFYPIQTAELPHLSYEVYVLDKPEPIKSAKDLNPEKYGILVRSSLAKSGLLLPGLEGIETPEKQIYLACQKAGIDPEKEPLTIYRFKAEKYVSD